MYKVRKIILVFFPNKLQSPFIYKDTHESKMIMYIAFHSDNHF